METQDKIMKLTVIELILFLIALFIVLFDTNLYKAGESTWEVYFIALTHSWKGIIFIIITVSFNLTMLTGIVLTVFANDNIEDSEIDHRINGDYNN